ncbi:MAG: RtcB family protein [Chthoniobacterales bacterium]
MRGVFGIIPGSMTALGFLVRGRGNTESLCSASHGVGRVINGYAE